MLFLEKAAQLIIIIKRVLNMISRPLSPHLQVYKLPLAAIISISHRIMGGVFFAAGIIIALICLMWLASINLGWLSAIVFSWVGKMKAALLIVGIVFYALTEIRYIIWGLNYGMTSTFVSTSNILIMAGTLAISTICWVKMWCCL